MIRQSNRMRAWAGVGMMLACLCIATQSLAQDKARVNLAWLPQGSTGGILVALAKGYYKEAGIDVTVQRGYGGQRTVNEIDQGQFEFGYGDPISVILNRTQGGKTVMVGAINTRWPAALCYIDKPGRTVRTPADLKGMVIAGGGASPVQNIVPAWLQANKLPANNAKMLRLDPAVINNLFLDGGADLAECWEGANKPLLETLAQRQGKKIGFIRYRDFNLDLYGNGIVTSEKVIAQNPDMVRRFVQATYKGYAYQRNDPKGAAEIIASEHRLTDRKILQQQIEETNQLLSDPQAQNKAAGWMRADRMQSTLDFVTQAYKLTTRPALADIYTNRFVEHTSGKQE